MIVQAPDNKTIDFGDMPPEQVQAAMQNLYPPKSQMVAENMNEMGNGASGAIKQLGAYGANIAQAIPFSDEIASGVGATLGAGKGSDFSSRYNNLQQRQEAFRQAGLNMQPRIQTPSYMPDITPSGIGQTGATLALAPLLPSAGPAATLPGAVAKGAATGAGYGALYGAGEGNAFAPTNDSAVSRITNAINGGLTGGALGAAAPLAGAALTKGGQALGLIADNPEPLPASELRKQANAAYASSEAKGALLSPDFSNELISRANSSVTEPERVTNVFGKNPAQDVAEGLKNEFGDTPMTLKEAMGLYQRLGKQIYTPENIMPNGKMTADGKQLFEIQSHLKEMINGAVENGHVTGDPSAIAEWQNGNRLWQQQAKTDDIQRIIARGEDFATDNPAQAIRAGFRTLVNNPKRLQQYSPQEQALIKQAASANLPLEVLRGLGSRLMNYVGLGEHGLGGFMAAQTVGSGARQLAGNIQANRGQDVINAIQGFQKPTTGVFSPAAVTATRGLQLYNQQGNQ